MLRVIFILLFALLGSAQSFADSACRGKQEIIAFIEDQLPGTRHEIFTGPESEAIADGITRTAAPLPNAKREFVVFSNPERETILVVGFKNDCYEGKVEITRKQLDDWLAGKGAQK